MTLGKRAGLWVKCARLSRPGESRFVVTEPHGSVPIFATDDAAELCDWLRDQTTTMHSPRPITEGAMA